MYGYDALGKNENGNLTIGGCDVKTLAKKYGTPLYIMDEQVIRENCRAYLTALKRHYGQNSYAAFASKAFSCAAIYRLLKEEGMRADVVSGGELYTALAAGFPVQDIYFHGNNKTPDELEYAVKTGVGRIIVDNLPELEKLVQIARKHDAKIKIGLRVKPGVNTHTHAKVQTGGEDSKFGVGLEEKQALDVVKRILAADNVELLCVNCHIGSQILESNPYIAAADTMISFLKSIKDETGFEVPELNIGGGLGIRYTEEQTPPSVDSFIADISAAIKKSCTGYGVKLPSLSVEPGRSIVGAAGITVYTVGSVKEIKGIRTYVAVDGGMVDNPRHALYGAVYDAMLPEKPDAPKDCVYTIAGRCCESGDIIAKDIRMPKTIAGDLIAVLATGAFNYSMSSNYNRIPRPPVIFAANGVDRPVVRRETYEDIIKNDIM